MSEENKREKKESVGWFETKRKEVSEQFFEKRGLEIRVVKEIMEEGRSDLESWRKRIGRGRKRRNKRK